MKKLIFSLLAISTFLASCSQKETNNDETSIHARADSIVGTRMQEINQQAMESLEQRIAVEVKAKADSIVEARRGGSPKKAVLPAADTTKVSRTSPIPTPMPRPATANPAGSFRTNDSSKR